MSALAQLHHLVCLSLQHNALQWQWLQVFLWIASAQFDPCPGLMVQWVNGLETPGWLCSDKDHPIRISHHHLFRQSAPLLFNLTEVDLDHHHTNDLTTRLNRRSEVVAPLLRGVPQGKIAPQLTCNCLLEVGPERKVAPDKGALTAPITGGKCQSITIHQVGICRTCTLVDLLQITVEAIHRITIVRILQHSQ